MEEIEYNLLDEKWIRVKMVDGTEKMVGFVEALTDAHEIKELCGEMPTQDFAIFRVLLAPVYRIYMSAGIGSETGRPESFSEAVDRWTSVWRYGRFEPDKIRSYLEIYRDRFWLFHPRDPFYQAPLNDMKTSEYGSCKLVGDLSQSSNKVKLFRKAEVKNEDGIPYDEAARWLIHLVAFDDTSGKPSVRGAGMPSAPVGWLGGLGIVYVRGKNLFETLMLNLVMADMRKEIYPDEPFVWEKPTTCKERVPVPTPHSPEGFLTFQSRRIMLVRSADRVVGYRLLGGDIASKENAFAETMTEWRPMKDAEGYTPARHDPARMMWREYTSLMAAETEDNHPPGVIRWAMLLKRKGVFPYDAVEVRSVGIKYASKDFFAESTIDDEIDFSSGLLSELGKGWTATIGTALKRTEDCVSQYGYFLKDLSVCSGIDGSQQNENTLKAISANGRALAYSRLNNQFRRWLSSIDPDTDSNSMRLDEWMAILERILVRDLASEDLAECSDQCFVGRSIDNNATAVYSRYRNTVKKIMRGENIGKKG